MADARLRQAHRLPGATIEAEVAALHARLRAGQLSPTQLRLAAYCGHLAALHVMGDLELLGFDRPPAAASEVGSGSSDTIPSGRPSGRT